MLNFNKNLKEIKLQTSHHNQVITLGYDDLFLNQRILIFSQPQISGMYHYLKKFDQAYNQLTSLGLDKIYAINSDNAFICPYVDSMSKTIKGLADLDKSFLKEISQSQDVIKPMHDLSTIWQYMVILNDGNIEKFWHNPIKVNMAWRIIKNPRYRGHGVGPQPVLEYLLDTQQKNK